MKWQEEKHSRDSHGRFSTHIGDGTQTTRTKVVNPTLRSGGRVPQMKKRRRGKTGAIEI